MDLKVLASVFTAIFIAELGDIFFLLKLFTNPYM